MKSSVTEARLHAQHDSHGHGRVAALESRLVAAWGPARVALLAMALAMLLWTLIEALGGSVLASMPPLELIWLRYLVHLALMLVFARRGTRSSLIRTAYPFRHIGRSLLMLGMPLSWVLAAQRLPMATLLSIFWTVPLVAVGLAAILLRERASRSTMLILGVGYLGTLAVLHPPPPVSRGGVLLAFGMCGCFALYLVGTRWLRRESTQVNLFHSALSVFVTLTFVMPFIWRWPTRDAVLPVLMIGVLGFVLLWFLDRATHLATVATIAPLAFLQPLVETIWFTLAGGGTIGRSVMLGTVLVVTAMVAALRLAPRDDKAVAEHAA
jgi:drug/metabolite transporter (DMT)-like permease